MNFFSYIFSTGPTLDSLYLKGNIQDAFDIETEEFLSIQLYKIDSTYNDSIIFNTQPTYLANTLDSTNYRFNNLREGQYMLIALKDVSDNYFLINYWDSLTDFFTAALIALFIILWNALFLLNTLIAASVTPPGLVTSFRKTSGALSEIEAK